MADLEVAQCVEVEVAAVLHHVHGLLGQPVRLQGERSGRRLHGIWAMETGRGRC